MESHKFHVPNHQPDMVQTHFQTNIFMFLQKVIRDEFWPIPTSLGLCSKPRWARKVSPKDNLHFVKLHQSRQLKREYLGTCPYQECIMNWKQHDLYHLYSCSLRTKPHWMDFPAWHVWLPEAILKTDDCLWSCLKIYPKIHGFIMVLSRKNLGGRPGHRERKEKNARF